MLDGRKRKCDPSAAFPGDYVQRPSFELRIGSEVAPHILVEEATAPEASARPGYLGKAGASGQPALLFVVTAAEARGLVPLKGLQHPHLAQVLDVVFRPEGDAVLVVERVAGRTLATSLAEDGKLDPLGAASAVLRLADALVALHQLGAIHGLVRPASVVADAEGGRHSPLLTFAPPPDDASPYRSPVRGPAGDPSVADDTWALAGLLYEMVTGAAPPVAGVAAEADLEAVDVADEPLRKVIVHGLSSDESARAQDVISFKRELAHWFMDHAGGDRDSLRPASLTPPPLPTPPPATVSSPVPSVGPGASKVPPPTPARRSRLPLALVALPLGIAVAWGGMVLVAKGRVKVVEVQRDTPAAVSAASSKSIDLSDVPVTGHGDAGTLDQLATCVSGYLPKDAFPGKVPDLGWVCSERDPRSGAQRLRNSVVTASGGKPGDAMKIVSELGWYGMAAFAVISTGCCTDPQPLTLPEPSPGCPSLSKPLGDIGTAVLEGSPREEADKRFAEAIDCEVKAHRATLFKQKGATDPGEKASFDRLVRGIKAP
jgi:serine/threonine protein kinase